MIALTRGVSSTTSTTSATCQVSRPSTAVPATDPRSCGSRSPPRSRARRSPGVAARAPTSRSSRSRGVDEHSRRAAVLRLERLAVVGEYDPCLAARDVLERQVRRVAAVAELDDVLGQVSTPSSSVSTETPSQTVSSFDHLVTQWMSTVTSSLGSARTPSTSSGEARRPRRRSRSPTGRATCAASARLRARGSLSVTYWPGGTRSLGASSRRPRKPREMMGGISPPSRRT